jgi:hypothetical protein
MKENNKYNIFGKSHLHMIFFCTLCKVVKFYKEFCKCKAPKFRGWERNVHISLENAHGALQPDCKDPIL